MTEQCYLRRMTKREAEKVVALFRKDGFEPILQKSYYGWLIGAKNLTWEQLDVFCDRHNINS
jgi:hypothetical protein